MIDRKPHRAGDKPAVIFPNGDKQWFIDGKKHRENDKPAGIYHDGTAEWWVNGEHHRDDDKPAIIHSGGYRDWYIKDWPINPKLKHYLVALEEDPSYIKHEQFRDGIKEFDIPLKAQDKLIKLDPSICKYIRNLDSRFSHLIMGNKFGVLDD